MSILAKFAILILLIIMMQTMLFGYLFTSNFETSKTKQDKMDRGESPETLLEEKKISLTYNVTYQPLTNGREIASWEKEKICIVTPITTSATWIGSLFKINPDVFYIPDPFTNLPAREITVSNLHSMLNCSYLDLEHSLSDKLTQSEWIQLTIPNSRRSHAPWMTQPGTLDLEAVHHQCLSKEVTVVKSPLFSSCQDIKEYGGDKTKVIFVIQDPREMFKNLAVQKARSSHNQGGRLMEELEEFLFGLERFRSCCEMMDQVMVIKYEELIKDRESAIVWLYERMQWKLEKTVFVQWRKDQDMSTIPDITSFTRVFKPRELQILDHKLSYWLSTFDYPPSSFSILLEEHGERQVK